jgi:dissimilatory sulfite reductase related protein
MTERTVTVGGKEIQLDEDGFLQQPDQWDMQVARDLAKGEGIMEMGPDHWRLINYLRDYYFMFGTAPIARKICKDCTLSLEDILELFPTGITKGACKVAGLPKPAGCV